MTLITQKFSIGDYVYYTNPEGDTIPNKILRVKFLPESRIFKYRIPNNSIDDRKSRSVWVTDKNLKLQKED